jgi:ketosteroid isomerase-like protein
MSANLDLVRSIYADWERGDFFGRSDWADPNIEFVLADGPDPGSYSGIASMAEAWANRLRAWDGFRATVSEYRELDEDRVLVLLRQSGRGKFSGLDIADMGHPWDGANVVHVRDGRVTRLVAYGYADRALADLGLEE